MNNSNFPLNENIAIEELYNKALTHIHEAKIRIQRSVNTEMVRAYWLIGRDIIEAEQQGEKRANYGKYLIQNLSEKLTKEFGRGFGVSTLKDIRQFYLIYPDLGISHALRGQSTQEAISINLGWTHYRALMRVDRKEARKFYEIEAEKNYWSASCLIKNVTESK